MKIVIVNTLILLWWIIATVIIIFTKIQVLLIYFLGFLFGIVWRFKPFKVHTPFTLKNLWEINTDYSSLIIEHFNEDQLIEKIEYK